MGQSTDAILGYGHAWADEYDVYEVMDDVEKRLKKAGLEMVVGAHCHHECQMLFLSTKHHYRRAMRGDPLTDMRIALPFGDAWETELEKAYTVICEAFEAHDMDAPERPATWGYFLCSDWS